MFCTEHSRVPAIVLIGIWSKGLSQKVYRITELNGFLEAPGGLYTTCDNTPLLNITQFVPLIRDTMIGGLIFDQTCKLQYEHMYNLMLTIFLLFYGYSRGKVLFNFCTYLQFL